MKRNQLLSLLLTLLMATGVSSALADTYVNEKYSAESTADGWTTSVNGDNPRFTPIILNDGDDYFLSVNQGQRNNNGCVVTGTVLAGKVTAGQDFTLTFDMRLGNSSDQTPVSLQIRDAANSADIFSLTATAKRVDSWKVNGKDNNIVTLPNSGVNDIDNISWVSYKISRSGNLTFVTINNRENSEVILERTSVEGSATGGVGNVVFTTKRYYANFAIDNITLRDLEEGDVPNVTPTTYTIHYTDTNGQQIKDDKTITSYVGATVSASAADKADFFVGDDKWLCAYVVNSPLVLTESGTSNIITLKYRKAEVYEYKVIAVADGNEIAILNSKTSTFEGDVVKMPWPRYVIDGKMVYVRDAVDSQYYFDEENFYEGFFIHGYEYMPFKYGAVYYTEGEHINGAKVVSTGNSEARSSIAASGYAGEDDLVITTLPAGSYNLTAAAFLPGSAEATVSITDGTKTLISVTGSSANMKVESATITFEEETTLYLAKGGSANKALDYLLITTANAVDPIFSATTDEGVEMWFSITGDDECEVFAQNGSAISLSTTGTVTIPSVANGLKVTRIGERAFWLCSNLSSVNLPSTLTRIGEYNQEIKGKTNVEIIPVSA